MYCTYIGIIVFILVSVFARIPASTSYDELIKKFGPFKNFYSGTSKSTMFWKRVGRFPIGTWNNEGVMERAWRPTETGNRL